MTDALYRLTTLATICLTFLSLALSLALARPAIAETPALAYGEGLLWRIDTPGSQPSYLFGTIHLTDPRVTKLPPAVVKAVEEADSLTLELIMNAETERMLAAAARLTGDRTLNDILGDELYAEVLDATSAYGMFDGALRGLKPWVVLAVMSAPPEELMRAALGHLTVDATLQQMAFDRGISVHALETVAEQVEVLGGMPEADTVEMLRQAVEFQPQMHEMIERMIGRYLAVDLAGIQAIVVEQSVGDDQEILDRFMERMIDRRNLLMADRMAGVLVEGRAFVAVGALHLPGEAGVLSLLVQRGHRVTRVY
jgi:uncharacterized protein YbaP (TraB family)